MSDEAKRKQVADQCKVVAHLAEVLATVHLDYEMLIRDGRFAGLIDRFGNRTAGLMDVLGDILNGMDAVGPEDAWTHPIFEARKQFDFKGGSDV